MLFLSVFAQVTLEALAKSILSINRHINLNNIKVGAVLDCIQTKPFHLWQNPLSKIRIKPEQIKDLLEYMRENPIDTTQGAEIVENALRINQIDRSKAHMLEKREIGDGYLILTTIAFTLATLYASLIDFGDASIAFTIFGVYCFQMFLSEERDRVEELPEQ
eukprot:NODE_1325_length_1340_cov_0.258662.p2 type:complete len:162 gc:universal NODE_1325_length_1340_cov_0.258662:1130-645(-)